MRRLVLSFTVLMLCSTLMHAQTDFKHQFDAFTKRATAVHAEFKDSVNAAFAEAIRNNWERFRVDKAAERKNKPLPDTAVYRSERDSTAGGPLPVSEAVSHLQRNSMPAPETSLFNFIGSDESSRVVKFSFYDSPVSIRMPVEYGSFHLKDISEGGVSSFWKQLAAHDYAKTIQSCKACRDELGLNDWAMLELVQSLAGTVFSSGSDSERAVFAVFLLNQMNLKAKIARSGEALLCLFPSTQQIYGIKYITLDDVPYFIVGGGEDISELYTYKTEFSKQARPFDMGINVPMSVGQSLQPIILDKETSVFHSTLHVPLNSASMSFYAGYPQMDPIVYAMSVPGEVFGREIIGEVKELVKGYPDVTGKLGALLSFVQEDFSYMVDREQFGYEKPFFCEENFFYDYNDCEDRATLFSYLVRNVLGLRTLLLDYPDHMAVAVELSDEANGDYVNHDGGRFYVCDPSYIGAPVGRSMPRYRTVPAKLWEAY